MILPDERFFVPDQLSPGDALHRTTHMAVAAHADDIEIMAAHGILECFGLEERRFFGIVVTDGAGSPRNGVYAEFSDEQMRRIRRPEQEKAAIIGGYSGVAFLNYGSKIVKDPTRLSLVEDLKALLASARPRVVYTHNPADRHDTHVAVAIRTIQALRELREDCRPEALFGCEVWRGLDWLNNDERIALDVSAKPHILAAVLAMHDSQIAGGKRYDLATAGRRVANATFNDSHSVDRMEAATFAMDLTPLIHDPELAIGDYVLGYIDRFRKDVAARIDAFE